MDMYGLFKCLQSYSQGLKFIPKYIVFILYNNSYQRILGQKLLTY